MSNRPVRAKGEYREEEKRSNKKKVIQPGKPTPASWRLEET
jgi:hypothetical protein